MDTGGAVPVNSNTLYGFHDMALDPTQLGDGTGEKLRNGTDNDDE